MSTCRFAAPACAALASITSCVAALPAHAQESVIVAPAIVTAPIEHSPLQIEFDPKATQPGMPAHDGADYLKNIPGFSVIRKGGVDGDPVLRGMAGSRLNIMLDGEHILGGCGMRMDPPTAYVFPQSFDRVTVIKGPQTVLYGPASGAGTVLFERDPARALKPGVKLDASALRGSHARHDEMIDLNASNGTIYSRLTGTQSEAADYEDGDGRSVHSRYRRWSANGLVGWAPDAHTRIELSAAMSDGEAAYADRGMDGVKFDRTNAGLKFVRTNVSPLVSKIEFQTFYNYVDHVMDNFTLRTPPSPMMRMLSNPDRETFGARALVGFDLGERTQATAGIDHQSNEHSYRAALGAPRVDDAEFGTTGLFGELTHELDDRDRLVAGLRMDNWRARDMRETLTFSTMGMMGVTRANPDAGESRSRTLTSGFARWERRMEGGITTFAGIGHAQRAPDYWELFSGTMNPKESSTTLSAFGTRPEKTTQLDLGVQAKRERLQASLSVFYNRIDDYILIQSKFVKPALMGPGTRLATISRNVDATTWGGEAAVSYSLDAHWRAEGSLAYVRGENDTDNTALAQMTPLQARLGLRWDSGAWSAGGALRIVAAQNRVDPDKGNIVGQDIGPTGGFSTLSMNVGYKPMAGIALVAGVDNLFDRTYAEHISRSGATIAGFEQTLRINEPGRTLWLRAQVELD